MVKLITNGYWDNTNKFFNNMKLTVNAGQLGVCRMFRHSLMEMLRCSWDDTCDCRCSFKMSSFFKFCDMLHIVQSGDTLVLLCVDADHYISYSNSCFWTRIMKENAEIWPLAIHYFEWSCVYSLFCAVAHFHITKLYGWPLTILQFCCIWRHPPVTLF